VVEGADAFFPPFDQAQWQPVSRESHPADERNEFAIEFVDYRRP
jgi:dihydrofolate reductase